MSTSSIATCAGCGRTLLEKTMLGTLPLPGPPRAAIELVEYHMRPWAAVVHTRVKEGPKLHVDGNDLTIREFPWVCSRACLDAVRANPEYAATQQSGALTFGVMRVDLKDGDDLLTRTLGSEGAPPDAPSDAWVTVEAPRDARAEDGGKP